MKALVITAETQEVSVVEIDRENALRPMQEAVEGLVQCVEFPDSGFDMWMNEEGKLIGLPVNLAATKMWHIEYGPTDIIMGNVIITGPADEDGYSTELDAQTLTDLITFVESVGVLDDLGFVVN